METRQLFIIDKQQPGQHEKEGSSSWRLDEDTRQRGLAGVQLARQALAQALSRSFGTDTPHAA